VDPVADAIEQAARGGVELNQRQIDFLKDMQAERGPGVRFVIGTDPLVISVLDPNHEQVMEEERQWRANLPGWARQLRREAITLALPEWTWQDGDDADLHVCREYNSAGEFKGVGVHVSVSRPSSEEHAGGYFSGEDAAGLISVMFAGGTAD
jgi:hypothetical protein